MAFDDNPQVDASSERSEESVLVVRRVLSQKNGFICREEHPDFGVDLQAELIVNRQATGNKFVVQIKSAQSLSEVTSKGNKFLSLQFSTSRLGYLCRSAPGYGLVVLYDDSTKIAYYDFVEKIHQRLCSRSEPSAWKQQDSVNIHIPISNVLDESAVSSIHKLYQRRFSNHSLLVERYGTEFGIPVIAGALPSLSLDLAKPDTLAAFLEKYGFALFNRRDYAFLIQLIREVPLRRFEESYELSFLAGLVFSESDRLADAEYYVRKTRKLAAKPSEEERVLLDFCAARIDFHFGRINVEEYIATLTDLIPETRVEATRLNLMVRTDFLRVWSFPAGREKRTGEVILNEVRKTIKRIRESKLEATRRRVLLLAAAANLHQIGLSLKAFEVTALQIKQDVMGRVGLAERLAVARKLLSIFREAMGIVQEVQHEVDKSDEAKVVKPYLQHRLSSMIFSFAFNSMMLTGQLGPDMQDLLQAPFIGETEAFNEFVKIGALGEAYAALTTALELRVLHDDHFAPPMTGPTEAELTERIRGLERELDKPRYVSLVRRFLQQKTKEPPDSRGFSEMQPGDERKFAETFANALNLPADRLDNIITDINGQRIFAEAVPDRGVELLQDLRHTKSLETMYKQPVKYIAECRRCGYRTSSSSDIEIVIKELRSNHADKCSPQES
ncbi:DUF4365 domain-containing protein [Acidobacteria bacterium AH-259-O06]|nr:DUF4365 domain-containing protein [Acidobacteria bacterium AH-259-O06]